MSGEKRISVACRIRPRNNKNERYDIEAVKKQDDETLIITQPVEDGEKAVVHPFNFDHIFDENDSQRDIYAEAALDMIDLVIEGTNCTILAYGQTGSGKTYTVLGQVDSKGDSVVTPGSGLFLRALTDLFTYKDRSRRTLDVRISLSILEIYVDELRDLLAKKKKLTMREVDDDVTIPDLVNVEVETLSDVYRCYQVANNERSVTATSMNEGSSRSHAIFLVDVVQAPRDNPDANPLLSAEKMTSPLQGKKNVRTSRLVLTDLAGSERVKRSGVEGKAMQEAQAINKSLSTLGNVVNGLYLESKHIPYRDSKLTRLLRSSFVDPNSRVLLITNLSPAGESFQESLSSLRFANRVKGLKASAVQPVDPVAEQEFLEKLRLAEQIAADVRIAQGATEYRIQRPRATRADFYTNPGALKECIAEYQAQVKREAVEKAEREAQEIRAMVHDETQATIDAWRQRNENLKQQCEDAEAEFLRLEEDLKTCIADKERETEDAMNEAKRRKRDRRVAEERIEKLKEELAQADAEELRIQKDQRVAEAAFMDSTGQETELFDSMERAWRAQDDAFKRADHFIRHLLRYRRAQHQWVAACVVNEPLVCKIQEFKFFLAFAEIQDLIEEKLDYMITCAVEGGPPRKGGRKSANNINNPAASPEDSDSEVDDHDQMDYDPKMKPLRQINTHVQSTRAQVAFGRDDGLTTGPIDEEEADRMYLMGIYDADSLVPDILKYLQSGTMLLKHCRASKPHVRRFFLTEDLKELCWMDPDRPVRTSVPLSEVTKLVMGQYSKVFRRNQTEVTEPDFYLSFSVVLRGGKRTVDVVAETASEFEAWLLGLSNVLRIPPEWGHPLNLSKEEGVNLLDALEQRECSAAHVVPQLYLKLKEVVNTRKAEVMEALRFFGGDMQKVYHAVGGIHPPALNKDGALLMTKGELRYLANTDIFRTCVIWKLFERQRLIYDPAFRPPTPTPTPS